MSLLSGMYNESFLPVAQDNLETVPNKAKAIT